MINIKKKSLKDNTWIKRQFKDQYVTKAKSSGYRSRAAFKLIQIEEKFKIFKNAKNILDLGCAPGSWLQVLSKLNNISITGVDLLDIDPIEGVNFIKGDFNSKEVQNLLTDQFDVILSDIAPNTIGHRSTDHLRLINIIRSIISFAQSNLYKSGNLVMKLFNGTHLPEIKLQLAKMFSSVHLFKPDASRQESVEIYIVCLKKI